MEQARPNILRPNILYMHSHDTGRYIQPYGHALPTPHLQRLAEQGVLFRQAFSASSTCSPSRAALLTGQSPHSAGMLGLAHRGFSLYDYQQHLANVLRPVGYSSLLLGMQHEARDPALLGYDEIVEVASANTKDVVPRAVQLLKKGLPQPCFLSIGFSETHRPFHESLTAQDEKYMLPPAPLPDTPEVRRDMAAFKASVQKLDEAVGVVLAALEESGLAEHTLVICTTDHGLAFPRMKCNLTDHGIGVMLLMRGPGGFRGGKVCDALVSHIDIYPTLCELLHVPRPEWVQGRSLLPLIREEREQINEAIFAEVSYHAAYEPQRAVRTQRWKYIRYFDTHHRRPVLPNCDDSPTKDLLMRSGWGEATRRDEELYDLLFDPNEGCNRIDDPELSTIADAMRQRLMQWMRATHDPLLHGAIPLPAGALVNSPDQTSPEEPAPLIE
ncbi:sulfatase family protein [Ktedonobacter racemifer]|uniref:Sulfatase n=1 Tax=Ktedonobacter racemifer DSM 44963 TaxID=485913 RepID=D6U5C4_KTERA|nr:sulfatase [Ktedonobacter racemifer]EFH81704.1 sulfatase [Ktedonobacter racemifer DSM 44963]